MARAESKPTKPDPQEKPDTPLRAIDDLNARLSKARGIVAVIGDGAENRDTTFDHWDLALALYAVSDLLKEAEAAAQRLDAFRMVGGV